ncbi:MAG TPA: DUF3035 domain-containing protein [Stellaceae bacterium]|nr:DUF3035 domain-containing protein [Stellaceae bacterium]
MSHFTRTRGPGRGVALVSVLSIAGTLLSGCSGFKQAIGLEPTMPDEFAVEARAPLTIPPDFALRPPKPGAPRPQEVAADKLARRDLDSAGPGKADKQAAAPGLPPLPAGLSNAQAPNPNAEVAAGSLASKLLDYGAGGGAVENRKTTSLKGVY